MAYFLPSFFQKRLLRYALSRLDFLESEALDLDNLQFTIGQRSVVELRNVAIKVAKVIEQLDLPASVSPKHASIRILRITIPADLHASGIEVEIDGVDISVDVDYTGLRSNKSRSKSRGKPVPSHKDVANRPRTSGYLHHDPGGTQLIPTSEDLAASFLEAEPDNEKQELTAAVASRSGYLQQSSASVDGSFSEDGTGMPEGFSLPGFVANFFAGIADRLSVVIKRVAIALSLRIDAENPAEVLRLILKAEEIGLEKLQSPRESHIKQDPRRLIRVAGIELLVASDGEVLTQKSSPSSPKLSKSRSSVSPSLSRLQSLSESRDSQPPTTTSRMSRAQSRSSSSSSYAADAGLGLHDSILDSSDIFSSSRVPADNASSQASPELSRISPITSRELRMDALDRSSHSSPRTPTEESETDDLAESKVFSHGEAESMFMSAMTEIDRTTEAMPGGFDHHQQTSSIQESAGPQSISQGEASNQTTPISQSVESLARVDDKETEPETDLPKGLGDKLLDTTDQVVKRIVRINEVVLKIPLRKDSNADSQEHKMNQSQIYEQRRPTSSGNMANSARHARTDSSQSFYTSHSAMPLQAQDYNSYEISIGDVEFAVDIGLCHILVKAASQNSQLFQKTDQPSQPSSDQDSDLSAKLFLRSVVFNLMESVPDISNASTQVAITESTFDLPLDGTPLLQLQILKIRFELSKSSKNFDQRLFIHRIALSRETEKILSLFDPAAVQESFVASSMMLEDDDFILRQTDNRMDIVTKPVHITLDLLTLDDVLSRSGGLSSLLDLGNSFASTGTMKEQQHRPIAAPIRRRSVHFDDSNTQPQPDASTETKINVRISGTIVDLVGSESSMQIKSSSIKVVHRADRLRMNVSSISVKGPLLPRTTTTDLVSLRVNDLELIYLNAPLEEDLDRLLGILTPSKDKYEQDDDIMVDTLLRQRRKGGVLRVSLRDLQTSINGLRWTQRLTKLGEEISKLSSVTKYLPEDDRPGILTFLLLSRFDVRFELDKQFGPLVLHTNLLEAAHISVPSLIAAQISSLRLTRGKSDAILHELIPDMQESIIMGPPMLMCRFIADEMEPTVKLKLSNTCLEYSVPLLIAITGLAETAQAVLAQEVNVSSPKSTSISPVSSETSDLGRKIKFSLAFRNTAISLNPLDFPSRGLFLFTDAHFEYGSRHQVATTTVQINKAFIMIIDDVAKLGNESIGADPKLYFDQNDQVQLLVKSGYVPVGSISAAYADIKIAEEKPTGRQLIDVEFKNNLLFLETCADSTQTLFQILGGLSPPTPPAKVEKYRTEQKNIIPIEDMLASFTGNAFVSEQGPELGLQMEDDQTPTVSRIMSKPARTSGEDSSDDEDVFLSASQMEDDEDDEMTESSILAKSARTSTAGSLHITPVITADDEPALAQSIMMHSLIDFRDDHFTHKTSIGGTAHRWDSSKNTYGMGSEQTVQQSPLKVRVRDVHIIWNLFDGYDWQNTREVITQAVRDVEERAYARQRKRDSHRSPGSDEEDESVIGDVLFNSIYISIPANKDPRELTNAINMELGDGASETGSYTTSTTVTAATSKRHSSSRYKPKRLRLNRSKQHKMTFELEGLAADFLAFPSEAGEVESSVDIRVRKLEIFDHIPTSTWKKFATYMHDAGEREVGTDMIHIEILNVKPVADLAASEIVMKVTILPLRLHIDQDALDFLARFFEFKDDRVPPSTTPSNPPFIQRAEINPVQLKLDFKPKRVDYAALKSGRTTELMNFIVLDRADILLRRIILYGVSGFDRLGIMLNNIWTPDVRNNQLPTVLAGLAPVRSLVDVGSGVRDLVAIPIREYRKDGRIVRSIQKGAIAFAKTTTTELVNLGAKLAIGTQTVLQNVEGVLAPHAQQSRQTGYGSDSEDDDHQKVISNYADQPLGIVQGLRGAYASLERDLLLAKDAIVAVPGEIMADGSATGAARIVLKQSPTIILRPAIGVTKAMGQAFLGAGNTLDKQNRRRVEDKYKRY